jgi:hypothetical protein
VRNDQLGGLRLVNYVLAKNVRMRSTHRSGSSSQVFERKHEVGRARRGLSRRTSGAALRQVVSDQTLGDNLSGLLFIPRESNRTGRLLRVAEY